MELFVFFALSLIAGLFSGFVFGCSHTGLLRGFVKGLFIGGLVAFDMQLLGCAHLFCLLFLGAALTGSIVATYVDENHRCKRWFDFRRDLDL